MCTGFGWDADGDILAAVNGNSSTIILWDATTGKRSQIDAGVRDGLSCMMWSKRNCLLAVGTMKGNVVIYDHLNSKLVHPSRQLNMIKFNKNSYTHLLML